MGREIVAQVDDLAELVSRSTGKTRLDAIATDVFPGALMASYYARIAPRVLNPRGWIAPASCSSTRSPG